MVALAAVFVPVRLDMSGVASEMSKGLNGAARSAQGTSAAAGKTHGSVFGRQFGQSSGAEVEKSTRSEGTRTGSLFGRLFGQSSTAEVEKSTRSMGSRVGSTLGGVGRQFNVFGMGLAGSLGIGTAAVGALGAAAVSMGVQTASSMEQAQIGFATLLGSGQKAQAFLTQLQSFAAATPFELPGLIDSSRLLLGVGVSAKDTMGILQSFGNASSAVGVGQENFQRIMLATSQAIGAGRFMTQDLNQITENGIPIWTILSRAMGRPVPVLRQLASQGKLLSSDVLPVLERQMNKDYGGAMERQSRSLSGVWSTFMDTLNIGLANVIRPLIPAMEVGLTGATRVLTVVLGGIPRLFSGAGASGSGFGTVIRNLAGWVTGSLVPAFMGVAQRVLPAVRGAITSIGAAFRDHQDVVVAVGQVFQGLGWILTRVLIPAIGLAAVALYATLGPAVRILLTLASVIVTVVRTTIVTTARIGSAIAGAFTGAYRAMDSFGTAINTGVTNAVSGAYRVLSGFGTAVNNAIRGGFRAAGTWLLGIGSTILNGLIAGFNAVWPHLVIAAGHTRDGIMIAFRAAGTMLVGAGRAVITGLVRGLTAMFGPVATAVAGFVSRYIIAPMSRSLTWWLGPGRNIITGLLNGARAMFTTTAGTVAGFINRYLIAPFVRAGVWLVVSGRNFIGGLLNGARAIFASVTATVSGFISQRLVAPFAPAIRWLVGPGRNIITGLISGMGAIARTVAGWVSSRVIAPITSRFTGAIGWLRAAGSNIISGLLGGISGAIANVRNWVSAHIVNPIINAVKFFFGISSPSTVMAGIGVNLIAGLIQGLVRTNPTRFIGKIFGGMPEALGAIVNKGLVAITSLPAKAMSALTGVASKVGGIVGGLFSSAPGTGSGVGTYGRGVSQWSSVVLQALQMLGQPASWLGTVLSRMQRESGGNPRAINLTDINAQRGDPSKGLMQTISGTFNAYAGPLRGRGIYDPLANVYAGLNYALHRYGSLAALSRPGGYDAGGWLPPGGVGMNLTGSPERVLDPQASAAYTSGRGAGDVRVHVYFDGTLVDDRVRVVVEDGFDTFGAMLDNS